MISTSTDGTTLTIEIDPIDVPVNPRQLVEAVANSIDVDFVRLENDGAPVFLGNSYAEFQMSLLLPKFDSQEHTFGLGEMECETLNHDLIAHVEAMD